MGHVWLVVVLAAGAAWVAVFACIVASRRRQ